MKDLNGGYGLPVNLSSDGLLWLINRSLFHPRGHALAAAHKGDGVDSFHLLGDGREVWQFGPDCDEDAYFAKVERTFARARIKNA